MGSPRKRQRQFEKTPSKKESSTNGNLELGPLNPNLESVYKACYVHTTPSPKTWSLSKNPLRVASRFFYGIQLTLSFPGLGPGPGVQPPKQHWPQAANTGNLYYAQITNIIVVVFAELHGTISLENWIVWRAVMEPKRRRKAGAIVRPHQTLQKKEEDLIYTQQHT